MSAADDQYENIDALAARYRAGRAPAGLAQRIAAQAPARESRSPWRGPIIASVAAAVLAVVAGPLLLRGPGDLPTGDPRWRVSATMPEPPQRPAPAVGTIRVDLSLRTPRRPPETAAPNDGDAPAG